MKKYVLFSLALFVGVSFLSACKPKEESSAQLARKARSIVLTTPKKEKRAVSVDELTAKKLAAYEQIYYTLINDQEGVPNAYKVLTKKWIKSSDSLYIKDLEQVIERLKTIKADTDGGLKDTDKLAEKVLTISENILAKEQEMKEALKENKALNPLERIKGKYPKIEKDYEEALNVLSEFGADLLKNKRIIVEKKLEALRNEGDDLRYYTEEMLLLAEELLAIFDDPKVPFNRQEAFVKANDLVAQLGTKTKAQRKVIEDMKRQGIEVNPYYDMISHNVAAIMVDYRQVRDTRSTYAFKDMLDKYDEAMKNYNNVSLKK